MRGGFEMKKLLVYLLSFFIFVMPSFAEDQNYSDNFTKDTEYYILWNDLALPMLNIFSEEERDLFIKFLISSGYYDEEGNSIKISMYNLGLNCYTFLLKIKNVSDENNEYVNMCINTAFDIFENATGKNKKQLIDENNAVEEEIHKDDIYDIVYKYNPAVGNAMPNIVFGRLLSGYIVSKYCKTGRFQIFCYPEPKLECDFVNNTKYLDRDMRLYCDQSNWTTIKYTDDSYEIRLRK